MGLREAVLFCTRKTSNFVQEKPQIVKCISFICVHVLGRASKLVAIYYKRKIAILLLNKKEREDVTASYESFSQIVIDI